MNEQTKKRALLCVYNITTGGCGYATIRMDTNNTTSIPSEPEVAAAMSLIQDSMTSGAKAILTSCPVFLTDEH